MQHHDPMIALRINASQAAVMAMQGTGLSARKNAAYYGLARRGLQESPYNTDFKNWVSTFESKAQQVIVASGKGQTMGPWAVQAMNRRLCALAPGYFPRSWCHTAVEHRGARITHRRATHVFPPPPPPGHGHYLSPSGHVHYFDKITGKVTFVSPPPPPGVTFIAPRPPTRAHAVFVAPPLPPPPTARVQVRYVPAPLPPPGLIHYVTRSGQVHYVNPITKEIVFVAPAPPPGVVFVAPPPPTPQAAIVVAPPSAPPPPAVVVQAPSLTPVVSPATVVDQGSDQIRQKATELANGLILENRDAFASAQKLSLEAQGGDWLSKQVLDKAREILHGDSAPDDMLHAVDWASNGDPNDLDSLDGAKGSGGPDPYGSISGDPRGSSGLARRQVEAVVRGADTGDQVSVALLAQLRKEALAGNPVARANFAHALRYAKSRAGSDANTSMAGCFGGEYSRFTARSDRFAGFGSCASPCYNCVKIGGECAGCASKRSARVGFGSCASPCYNCVKIGGEYSRYTARSDRFAGFGSCETPCYNCVKIGCEGARTDGAMEGRFGMDALDVACPCNTGFGDDPPTAFTSMAYTQPTGVSIPQAGVPDSSDYLAGQTVTHMAYTQPSGVSLPNAGLSAGFGAAAHHRAAHHAAAHHAHKKAVHHAKKRAIHAKRMELHRRALNHHPAFQDGSGSGGSGGSGGGGDRQPPLKQLFLAAQQGNKQAQARIQSIMQRAKAGDLRAQSLAKALQAFAAAGGSAAQKTGRAVKLSHGKPLTTAQVHGIAAEFGGEAIHVLRGIRAPHAPLPQSASQAVRQAMAAGQIVGQAQELQAVRFPGAPLPAGVQWEIGRK